MSALNHNPNPKAKGSCGCPAQINGSVIADNDEITLASGSLLTIRTDGTFEFVPGGVLVGLIEGEAATDTFTYTINDDLGNADTATVTVRVTGTATPLGSLTIDVPDGLAPGELGYAVVTFTAPDEFSDAVTGSGAVLLAVTAEDGLVGDPLSRGFSDTTFVLARGGDDGFGLGETDTIEVAIRGTAGPRSTMAGAVQLADPEANSNIAARVAALQPSFVAADTVSRIESNVAAQFGTTIGSLTNVLAAYADRFETFGLNASSATGALAFAIEAAGDFGSLEERGKVTSLGQGWSTLSDLGLAIDGDEVQLQGLPDIGALRALTIEASALYTISNSVGRSVALSGDVLAIAAPVRPAFQQQIDGQYQTVGAFDGTLRQTTDGFVIELADGDQLLFDGAGVFDRMVMTDGLEVVASYDGDSQLVGLSGPNGDALTFVRAVDGSLQSVTDADGRAATFAYDADGMLSAVTRPDGTSSFVYNADGDLTGATAPGDIGASFTYDAFGRLEAAEYGGGLQTETIAYDDAGGVTITDGAGRSTDLSLLPGAIAGRFSDGLGNEAEIFFDDEGNIAGVRAPDGAETGFVFDGQGRLTDITDANGATVSFAYADTGEDPESFTDAGGNTRVFEYDAGGRITGATWPDGTMLGFSYDDEGNLTGYTNRRGDGVTYTYDERGRLLTESDSSAGPVTYTYDAQGRLETATNDHGTTALEYDSADRVTRIDYPTGKSLIYTYNDAGLRASMSDGADYNLFYDYDALGRLTGLRDEDSTIVEYTYDAGGNLIREENGNGTVSTFEYDEAGRLTIIENKAPDDSLNSRFEYTYDAAGQRVGVETLDGTWTYGYDAIGQLTSAAFVSVNPEIDDKSLVYEYDAAGNRTRVVEDGVETLYTVNALNQYTQVGEATFTYDDDGNMTSKTDGEGTTTYTYDSGNRLVSVDGVDGSVTQYEYDVFGNRTMSNKGGDTTEFFYDPAGTGSLLGTSDGFTEYYYGIGLVSAASGANDVYFNHDAVGSISETTAGGGSVLDEYAYDPFGNEIFSLNISDNPFRFNGALGVRTEGGGFLSMGNRFYESATGRFVSEDPAWADGDPGNLYRFAANSPLTYADPIGLEPGVWFFGGSASGFVGYGGGVSGGVYYNRSNGDFGVYYGGKVGAGYGAAIGVEGGRAGGIDGLNGLGGYVEIDVGVSAQNTGNENGIERVKTVGAGLGVVASAGVSAGETFSLKPFAETLWDWFVPDWLNDLTGDPAGEYGPDNDGDGIPDNLPPGASYIPPVDPANPFPEEDSSPIGPAPGSRNDGDPHLTTFDGTGYSFQGAGEFTMVIGEGFEMQTRMEPINANVSVNTATVMSFGDDIVGIYAQEEIPLIINGVPVALEKNESIAVGTGTVQRGDFGRGGGFGEFDVYILTDENGNGFWTNVYFGANHLRPFVAADSDVAGLLGNLNGDRSDDFQLRDGTVLGGSIAETVLYGEYADSWRITQENSLFIYGEGESTETFTDRDFPANIRSFSDLTPEERAPAEAIAIAAGLTPGTFEFETTVLDIVVTGDPIFAEGVAGAIETRDPDDTPEIIEAEINRAPNLGGGPTPAAVDEEGSVTIDVLDGIRDPEGDTISVEAGVDPNGGTVSVVNGQLVFMPAPNFFGTTQVSYFVLDDMGNRVISSVEVTVANVPDDPEAMDDVFEGTATITGSVLANDVDVDGDELTAELVTGPMFGSLTLNPDGAFTYRAAAGFVGEDRFTYAARDEIGATDLAEVVLKVNETGLNVITGTNGRDILLGTAGDDEIRSLAGPFDRMTGGAGADVYAFGSETVNGVRERDIINDFEVGVDQILLDNGAVIDRVGTERGAVILFLAGDGDAIIVNGVGVTPENLTIVNIGVAANENALVGTAGVDMLIGAELADTLTGGDGGDMLFGGEGNDVLIGDGGDAAAMAELLVQYGIG